MRTEPVLREENSSFKSHQSLSNLLTHCEHVGEILYCETMKSLNIHKVFLKTHGSDTGPALTQTHNNTLARGLLPVSGLHCVHSMANRGRARSSVWLAVPAQALEKHFQGASQYVQHCSDVAHSLFFFLSFFSTLTAEFALC